MAVSFIAGGASALAMEPVSAFPVLALTFPILVWLIDGTERGRAGLKAAAWIGFAFGFGYFLAGLWWIGAAFLVDAEEYAWALPIAVVGLPLFLACFPALGLVIARLLWSDSGWRIFALAAGLGLSEILRTRVFTGFPWNQYGYALADNEWFGQAASIVGVEGLTPIAIAIFATPALLADPGRPLRPLLGAVAALVVLAGFGAARLAIAEPEEVPGIHVRIVQPNVPQDRKFRPEAKPEIMARYLALSSRPSAAAPNGIEEGDILIWPESAFPFFLGRTPDALAQIGGLLPDKAILLTGAARIEDALDATGRRKVFNSIQAVASDGSIIATYDKVHLVPFGEFLPFQALLESLGIRQLTRLPGGFSSGEAPGNITLPNGLKLGGLICYEAIFPTGTIDGDDRPAVLLNLTNDAWFGDTPGPYQHLAQARVRAVEQGLPILRAANTGISSLVDPWGRIVAALPLGEDGVLDLTLPQPLPPTLFSRFGLVFCAGLYGATIVGALRGRRRV
ncbi:apolipoprotein N-acyltransferase [Flaviflagellibacter deserti]|uniref:Apolipoprotein N-acyltransferase n=1 Tax=Flaviflagellibacter deserti TaxID=2267266 RepID=A0ABV9Z4U3_9HYPH